MFQENTTLYPVRNAAERSMICYPAVASNIGKAVQEFVDSNFDLSSKPLKGNCEIVASNRDSSIFWFRGTFGMPLYCISSILNYQTAYDNYGKIDHHLGRHLKMRGNDNWLNLLPPLMPDAIWDHLKYSNPALAAKNEESRDRLATVMANLVQSIRICTAMLYPYIPSTAKRIAEVFAFENDAYDYDKLDYSFKVDGVTVNADGAKLFERIDEKKFMAAIEEAEKAKKKEEKAKEKAEKKAEKVKEPIGIEDFAKVELTVGKILTCEKVEKSDKLLKLTVDIGEVRQVVSGIAKWYAPEDLIGKKIILVSNLRPAMLRGVESNGMILASGETDVKVVFIDDSVPVGSKVR
jgi:methionine--tRNA ligase beta chain